MTPHARPSTPTGFASHVHGGSGNVSGHGSETHVSKRGGMMVDGVLVVVAETGGTEILVDDTPDLMCVMRPRVVCLYGWIDA
mmetsp:Transcript_3675/g.8379  ORF Transcript_3675/g.8379 Transcript_3675/m.8379 type:complete len:82 (+) Transcript_3675:112-357(+)